MIPAGIHCLECGLDYLARTDDGLVYCLRCRDTAFVVAGPPGPPSLARFLFSRLREDERRDRRRILFRGWHQSFTASRRQAVEIAGTWMDHPEFRESGERWLRNVARNYRSHPDYREEWKP